MANMDLQIEISGRGVEQMNRVFKPLVFATRVQAVKTSPTINPRICS